jgi:osmotically-inducible protein OsmY
VPTAPSPLSTQPIEGKSSVESPRPAPSTDTTEVPAIKRSKGRSVAIVAVALVLAGGVGGLLYWKGIIGNRLDAVAETIMAAAHEKGFEGITVTVSPGWVANVSGIVVGQVRKDELIALVQQDPNIKRVNDDLTVRPGPGELEQQLADALNARGLTSVSASVGTDLVATLKGTVDDPTLETVALDTARGVNGLKDVQSAIKLSIPARQAALTQALATGGYDQVTAQIVDENSVNVTGNVYSQEVKDNLVALVSSTTGIATVNDTTKIIERPPVIDVAKIEADINKQLQKAGLGAVAAVVDEKLNATLVGTVTRASDRDRAIKTARKVTAIKSLRSEIDVAGAAVPAPAATVVQETMALNAVKGQWVGRVDTGLFGYAFTLNITGGAIGQDVGTSLYGSGNKGLCGGSLTLAEASGSDFTFTEHLDRTAMMCPGGGTLKMKLSGDGKALFEWYRPKNPTKRYGKGTGVRR